MEQILVLDFGGQYDQLIARRVREQKVYAQVRYYDRICLAEIAKGGYRGIIFTGGPNSVYEPDAPGYDPAVLDLGIPILGICYGGQLLARLAGGKVGGAGHAGEYGKTRLHVTESILFRNVPEESICWMSHRDEVTELPKGFRTIAATGQCGIAAIGDDARRLYGVQFHPEVTHTEYGAQILHNFLFEICGCKGEWDVRDYADTLVEHYKAGLAGKKVLLALSGGVDSSVCALLLHKAVGKDLTCVFVDHGLLRKDEGDEVAQAFRQEQGRAREGTGMFRQEQGASRQDDRMRSLKFIIGIPLARCRRNDLSSNSHPRHTYDTSRMGAQASAISRRIPDPLCNPVWSECH